MRRWKIEKIKVRVDMRMNTVKIYMSEIDKRIGRHTDVLESKKYRESQRRNMMSWEEWLEWMEFGE